MSGITPEALLPALVLVLAGALEIVAPWRTLQGPAGRRWINNLGLFGLCFGLGYVMAPFVAYAVAAVGLPPGPLAHIAAPSIRILLAIVILDLLDYGMHRALHRFPLLWRVHQPHHSDVELDVTTALRHHPLEAALTSVVLGGGGALVGIAPREIAVYGALALGVQLVAHANLTLPRRLAAFVAPVLVTPDFHRLHHSRMRRQADANYGQLFSFWDRLFASRQHGEIDTIAFGVEGCDEAAARTLPRLLAEPLLRR
jgi:sterol desaturase/sphingolipid hydroxylase (fatty acid hydroxylase superfamily)